MRKPSEVLRQVFGHDAFRPGQEDIIQAVVAGRETLAIMPTGGGKSLCYQIPAVCRVGFTLVASPLIALKREQVQTLQTIGVPAAALCSANSDEENDRVYEALHAKELKILYMAPERLNKTHTQRLLIQAGVNLIAGDEAHCGSQWGHDFRPDFLSIGPLRVRLRVPLAAFTATADEETRQEIRGKLFSGSDAETFLFGFDRPNIHIAFAAKARPRQQILDFVRANRDTSGIVYCGTRNKTEVLSNALRDEGFNACHYHGGMIDGERRAVEERFRHEDALIVVATVAFGMGVDKPDIRWVAHADLPKSIEAYYQEIGRAGRDGAPAQTLTLFGSDDIRMRRAQIDESLAPMERKDIEHGKL